MSVVVYTIIGQPIRLNLQLSDGEASLPKVVKASLKDKSGNALQGYSDPVELIHVGGGLFKNNSVTMPENEEEITSQYVVYNEDGVVPDTSYSMDMDIFLPAIQTTSSQANAEKELDIIVEDSFEELEAIFVEEED